MDNRSTHTQCMRIVKIGINWPSDSANTAYYWEIPARFCISFSIFFVSLSLNHIYMRASPPIHNPAISEYKPHYYYFPDRLRFPLILFWDKPYFGERERGLGIWRISEKERNGSCGGRSEDWFDDHHSLRSERTVQA